METWREQLEGNVDRDDWLGMELGSDVRGHGPIADLVRWVVQWVRMG